MKRELSNCCCLLPCSASWCFGVFGIARREKRGRKANAEWWWRLLMKRCHVGALRSARDLPGGRSVENEKWIKKNVRSERYAINKVKHNTHTHKKLHLFTKALVSALTNRRNDCRWLAWWQMPCELSKMMAARALRWLTDEAASWAALALNGRSLRACQCWELAKAGRSRRFNCCLRVKSLIFWN